MSEFTNPIGDFPDWTEEKILIIIFIMVYINEVDNTVYYVCRLIININI